MNNKALAEAESFLQKYPDVEQIELISTDINGNQFAKRYPIHKLGGLVDDGVAVARAMYVLDVKGETLEGIYHGGEDGDPDVPGAIVRGSLRYCNWRNRPRALGMISPRDEEGVFDPRAILSKILQRFNKIGLKPVAAFELEFYLFQPLSADSVDIAKSPVTGDRDSAAMLGRDRLCDFEVVLDDIVDACTALGVSTEAICAEMGAGQFEINFSHHDDILEAADQAILFKIVVKDIAKRHGLRASFMAKPLLEEPGSGLHKHVSLLDEQGNNVFSAGDEASPLLLSAVAGLMALMPSCMSIWAPNRNSYRRFETDNCVTVSRSWAYENRTVAFRIPLTRGNPKAWRVENRVAGADANLYLAMASSLAAIHHGITQNLKAPPISENNVNALDKSLPLNLRTALKETLSSDVLRGYLGDDFIDMYCQHRQAELDNLENSISQREYQWYL